MESIRNIDFDELHSRLNIWEVEHPDVKFIFKRGANGKKCFMCEPTQSSKNKRLFISAFYLADLFRQVEMWKDSSYDKEEQTTEKRRVYHFPNQKAIIVSLSKDSDDGNCEILDVRYHYKCGESDDDENYIRTDLGFSIKGEENIISFLKLNDIIDMKIRKVEMLDELKRLIILYAERLMEEEEEGKEEKSEEEGEENKNLE